MRIKSQKDFWSGLMFVAVGIGFAWGSTNYSFGGGVRPGPGYFPFGLGILMAVLGAVVTLNGLSLRAGDREPIGRWAWKPLLVIVASVAVFGLLLPRLGMVATLPILVVMSALAGGEFRWQDALINAVVLTVGSWAIFIWGLKLTIPMWPGFVGG